MVHLFFLNTESHRPIFRDSRRFGGTETENPGSSLREFSRIGFLPLETPYDGCLLLLWLLGGIEGVNTRTERRKKRIQDGLVCIIIQGKAFRSGRFPA